MPAIRAASFLRSQEIHQAQGLQPPGLRRKKTALATRGAKAVRMKEFLVELFLSVATGGAANLGPSSLPCY